MLSTQTITEYLDCNAVRRATEAFMRRGLPLSYGALLGTVAHHLAGDADEDGAYEDGLLSILRDGIDREALREDLAEGATARRVIVASHVAGAGIPEYRDWRADRDADLRDAEMDRRYDASRGN